MENNTAPTSPSAAPASPPTSTEISSTQKKNRGGRPKKQAGQLRKHKHTVFLSEGEEKQLQQLMEKTGKSEAELFRYAVLGKGLHIPRARMIPEELQETLTSFKRLASLHQYLATKEKDFSNREREQLLGSSHSLRAAVERLERSVCLSLDKANGISVLQQVVDELAELLEKKSTSGQGQWSEAEEKGVERALAKVRNLLLSHGQYLTLR